MELPTMFANTDLDESADLPIASIPWVAPDVSSLIGVSLISFAFAEI